MAARLSIYLAVFNLLPVPPLDGSKLLIALRFPRAIYIELARFGFVLLMLLFAMTGFGGWIAGVSDSVTYSLFRLVHAV